MAGSSFFVQTPEAALRHVNLLAKGLKKVAWAGLAGGVGCSALAALVSHLLVTSSPQPITTPGFREMSGITFVTWFMALALLGFSTLYLIAGWGLSNQNPWARYMAAAVFLAKVLLCVWLGRGSLGAMIVFLTVAVWDIYGLWVLLAKESGQLFTSSPGTSSETARTFDSPTTKARRA
jgi:hypothetical protein